MSEINISPTSSESAPTAQVQPSSSDPSVAGNVAQANKTTTKGYDMNTTVGSLDELKEKAPEVYQKMMEGIAFSVITSMKRHQEHLEKVWRENRDNARG